MRGDSGVASEERVFGVPKFHFWTMPLANINSDRIVQRFLRPAYYINWGEPERAPH